LVLAALAKLTAKYGGTVTSGQLYIFAPYMPRAELVHNVGEIWGIPYFLVTPFAYGEGNKAAMVQWCQDSFGPGKWALRMRWWWDDHHFWFRDAADRDWFVLKWAR
jgi:hypothetical protein